MIIEVDGSGIRLKEASVFTMFKVSVVSVMSDTYLEATLSQAAAQVDDDYAWIRINWLLSQVPEAAAEWRAQFDGMLAYARGKGWVDDAAQAIRAHIERE